MEFIPLKGGKRLPGDKYKSICFLFAGLHVCLTKTATGRGSLYNN
ncbi:hypothetical protein P886_3943 [Alteromonadaceae bacterium 2753L.S.0a.02]|nr:hypothetical protein P886_3943 [Alteromonadaceae bacterium 2753L.S.0a.02]